MSTLKHNALSKQMASLSLHCTVKIDGLCTVPVSGWMLKAGTVLSLCINPYVTFPFVPSSASTAWTCKTKVPTGWFSSTEVRSLYCRHWKRGKNTKQWGELVDQVIYPSKRVTLHSLCWILPIQLKYNMHSFRNASIVLERSHQEMQNFTIIAEAILLQYWTREQRIFAISYKNPSHFNIYWTSENHSCIIRTLFPATHFQQLLRIKAEYTLNIMQSIGGNSHPQSH